MSALAHNGSRTTPTDAKNVNIERIGRELAKLEVDSSYWELKHIRGFERPADIKYSQTAEDLLRRVNRGSTRRSWQVNLRIEWLIRRGIDDSEPKFLKEMLQVSTFGQECSSQQSQAFGLGNVNQLGKQK